MGPTRLDYPHYFIGSKPAKLFIGSEEYEVKSRISVARIVLAQVNATRRNELRKLAGTYTGWSRIILGTKGEGMDKPIKIDDDVYFEGHFGTEAIIMHLMRICKYTGFDTNSILVTLRYR